VLIECEDGWAPDPVWTFFRREKSLSVKGYTRLDKIKGEVIRRELEISGIRDA
jgi:hypothetical protein